MSIAVMLGLAVGSFANVVIYRSPLEGLTSVRPSRSFCPSCQAQLTWFDNIPVLAWLLLRGRCRSCGTPISWRYPLVEVVVALLFAGAWWRVGPTDAFGMLDFAIVAYLAVTCVIVSLIDLEHLIIPDTITLPGLALGLIVSVCLPSLHVGHVFFREASPHISSLFAGIGGAAAGGGSLWIVGKIGALFLRRQMEAAGVEDAMGFGDVKWMAHTGAFLGVAGALGAIVSACFAGALIGILMKLVAWMQGGREPQPIPFGPFLSMGILVELASPGFAWNLLQAIAQPA